MSRHQEHLSRWVGRIAVAGTIGLAVGAFSLSFTSLARLAARAGIDQSQAWEWPLIVDGVIVVATIAVVALAGRKGASYAWGLLAGGAAVSIGGNGIEATRLDTTVSPWLAVAVATIPPLVLLAATHLTVILTRPQTGQELSNQELSPDAAGTSDAEFRDRHAGTGGPPQNPLAGHTIIDPAETRGASDGTVVAAQASEGSDSGESPSRATTSGSASGEGLRTWRKEKARDLHAEGQPIAYIAEQIGVSPRSVRRYLTATAQKGTHHE